MRNVVLVILLAVALSAQEKQVTGNKSRETGRTTSTVDVHYINPPRLAVNPRFSQMVEIDGGRTILISGQVAWWFRPPAPRTK